MLLRLLPPLLKEEMSQLTFSRLLLKLVEDVVLLLVVAQETYSVLLELELEQALLQVGWETWTFFVITLNSNNSDKSSSKTLRCSSRFCNKLALATLNWLN